MSDRYQLITVALDEERTREQLEPIIAALRMVKGVAGVTPGQPLSASDYLATMNTRRETIMGLMQLVSIADQPEFAEAVAVCEKVKQRRGY